MIKIYTQHEQGKCWIEQYKGCRPIFAPILGFTATGLIPGISAAGATPHDRQYTAIADAEFLVNGVQPNPTYPLPPLTVGVSPTYISRAVVEAFNLAVYIFNAGLPQLPVVPHINLEGFPANCLTSGQAMSLTTVKHLYTQGLKWGEKLAFEAKNSYLLIGECVVGGTTTALAILTGLGVNALGKVNSSHPHCNHAQKWAIVQQGLAKVDFFRSPFDLVAAVGDPMQIVAAGMAISASKTVGVMLAGGTQMLAIYALLQAIIQHTGERIKWDNIIVGTTRWVAEDPSGDTVGLATAIGTVPLVATSLSFAQSRYPQLQMYEQGYVKEGVGAGGCAIAAYLYRQWTEKDLLDAIESLLSQATTA